MPVVHLRFIEGKSAMSPSSTIPVSMLFGLFAHKPMGRSHQRAGLAALRLALAVGLCITTATALAQTKTATTTTLAVTSGSAAVTSVTSGKVVTLTATVTAGGSAATPGQVNFCDASAKYCTDIHLLGMAQLTSAGTATLKLRPGIGSHSYKAVFVGTNIYAGSFSGASALAVSGTHPTTTTIVQNGYPGNYSLTATVAGLDNTPDFAAPTGTVSFLDTSYGNTVLGTAALGSATAGLSFLNVSNPPTVSEPNVVATADFNGDGIPDLAVSNSNSGQTSLTILLGNGDGTFTATATSPTVGLYPDSIAIGDFNGDGIPDLAVTSVDDDKVTILLGKGDGTFTAAPNLNTVSIPQSVATGDFNGDGIPDLAVVNANSVLIFLGNGDGTFAPHLASAPTGMSPTSVAVGDFNGDGIADLAVVNNCGPSYPCNSSNGTVTILLGNGNGTFTAAPASPLTGPSPIGVAVADFNRDGILDLAVSDYDGNSDNAVTILLGNGDGTFKAPAYFGGAGLNYRFLALGDFNGDGIADLAVGEFWSGEESILLGQGDGTFAKAIGVGSNSPVNSGYIASADFNGDGISDLAVPNQDVSGTAAILLVNPTQSISATVSGISPVGAGTHSVDASYPGDSNYGSSVSGTVALTAGVALPAILPASGNFSSAQSITITDSTPGATIYYQASGAILTNGFVPYTGPIPMEGTGSLTIQAYATQTGSQQSGYASATYTVNFPSAATPVISLASGEYSSARTVTITDSTPGAAIYYTTNGTYPFTYSNLYSGPVTVSTSEVLVAFAIAPGYSGSGYATAQYDISSSATSFIYTIAGSDTPGYTGDGGPATFAEMNSPQSVAVDSAGNVYMADGVANVVRKTAASTGIITTIAGTGVAGHTGDSGPAASAELWWPSALAVDAAGNLFIGETGDNVVRRVDAGTGAITTFAGAPNGTGAPGGPATSFALDSINGLACDRLGNLYIAEGGEVVEVNTATGSIADVAGYTNNAGFASLTGIAVDKAGNIYVSDSAYSVVWKINPGGVVTVFAGSRYGASGGDGGLATQAGLSNPGGVAVDGAGNVYIADTWDSAIRKVNIGGFINTIAGVLYNPFTAGGDGSPATAVGFLYPQSIAADYAGNIYYADQGTYRIRKITVPTVPPTTAASAPVMSLAPGTYASSQTVTMTDATAGAEIYVSLNGSAPTTASEGYHGPIDVTGTVTIQAVAIAPGYLVSAPVTATYTITTPPTAVISTVAGNGKFGLSGSGGPATSAEMEQPRAVAFDGAGNLYIADPANNVVWMVAAGTGKIAILAGTGAGGNSGDGGQATTAQLLSPCGVAIDKSGNLYITDSGNGRIRMVAALTGVITTVAGPGVRTTLGDGGPATAAFLSSPSGLAFDPAGNLYIADVNNNRIRRIAANTGIISTVAGGGTYGQLGDGGLATAAYLAYPSDVTLDAAGNLYIPDNGNARIRKVDASTGVINTIAGNGLWGSTGDGGPATAAEIYPGQGIAVDNAGNLYFSNWVDTLRRVDAKTGIITTVAGDGYFGYGGDGGSATIAELDGPQGLAFDAAGNLYVADQGNYVVRKVTFPGPRVAPVITWAAPAPIAYGTALSSAQLNATTTVAGSFVYSPPAGTVLSAGQQTLKVTFTPTDTTDYTTSTASVTLTVSPATPTLSAVGSSLNPSMVLNSVILSAGVTSAAGTPSGSIAFFDGTTQLGSGTLSAGTATYTTSALAAGSHTITAVYSGDLNFASVTSAALTQIVESYTIGTPSGGTSSATVSPGGQATYTLAVTPPSLGPALTFSVSGLPTGATGTFSPSTLPAGSGPTNVTLTVSVPNTAAVRSTESPFSRGALPMLALILLPFAARLRRAPQQWLRIVILGIAGAAMAAGVSACGGGGSSSSPAPASSTYTLTVTATSGSLIQSTNLTLTVQ
jgi:sugar lactone lactonase YvrE